MADQPITLIGASGTKYTFYVYPWGQTFKAVGGVYAVTHATPDLGGGNNHSIIYIGQTGDLSERFENHHRAECFRKNGANCICAMAEANKENRLAIERDLIEKYNPPCNQV